MPRFSICSKIREKLRYYQPFDIYTQKYLKYQNRSIEHVIPCRILKTKEQCTNHEILYITELNVNRFRSDFFFGGSKDEILQEKKSWKELDGNFKHCQKKIFYPKKNHRLISHIIWKFLQRHPDVFPFENEIVFQEWLNMPWDPFQRHILECNSWINKI